MCNVKHQFLAKLLSLAFLQPKRRKAIFVLFNWLKERFVITYFKKESRWVTVPLRLDDQSFSTKFGRS
jgi:hypothetical protein